MDKAKVQGKVDRRHGPRLIDLVDIILKYIFYFSLCSHDGTVLFTRIMGGPYK